MGQLTQLHTINQTIKRFFEVTALLPGLKHKLTNKENKKK